MDPYGGGKMLASKHRGSCRGKVFRQINLHRQSGKQALVKAWRQARKAERRRVKAERRRVKAALQAAGWVRA